jgi:hypothetical protein
VRGADAAGAPSEVPLELGRQVLDLEGARAFLVAVGCSPQARCRIDRSVFSVGALGEPSAAGELGAEVSSAWLRGLTLRRLGEGLFASGHGEPALAILQHVSQHDPSPAERAAALSDVAAVAHGCGDLDSARQLLRGALTLYPAQPDALENARALDGASVLRAELSAAPGERATPQQRRLAIGAHPGAGWELLAEAPGIDVRHVGSLADLGSFAPHCFAELYVTGALEAYDLSRTEGLLAGLRRVLVPHGRLVLQVCDAARVARVLGEPEASVTEQLHVLRLLHGARGGRAAAFTEGVLRAMLSSAGFVRIERLEACPVLPGGGTEPRLRGGSLAMHLTARAPG